MKELRQEIKRATHDSLFDKLFGLYRLYIENADELAPLWSVGQGSDVSEIKRQYAGLFIIDLLYLMHLQWDNLDSGLKRTWYAWARKVLKEPRLYDLYSQMKQEYDPDFVKRVDSILSQQGASAS